MERRQSDRRRRRCLRLLAWRRQHRDRVRHLKALLHDARMQVAERQQALDAANDAIRRLARGAVCQMSPTMLQLCVIIDKDVGDPPLAIALAMEQLRGQMLEALARKW